MPSSASNAKEPARPVPATAASSRPRRKPPDPVAPFVSYPNRRVKPKPRTHSKKSTDDDPADSKHPPKTSSTHPPARAKSGAKGRPTSGVAKAGPADPPARAKSDTNGRPASSASKAPSNLPSSDSKAPSTDPPALAKSTANVRPTSSSAKEPLVRRVRPAAASPNRPSYAPPIRQSPLRAVANGLAGAAAVVGSLVRSIPSPRSLLGSPLESTTVSTLTASSESLGETEDSTQQDQPTENIDDDRLESMFQKDMAEEGDGGASDEEGEEIDEHNGAVRLNGNDDLDDNGLDLRESEKGIPSDSLRSSGIPGAPSQWIPPRPPPDFPGYQPKHDAPATFEEVDNPAGWSSFTFTPHYEKHGKSGWRYSGHRTPNNAEVVPTNKNGDRVAGGYAFHYQGYTPSEFASSTYKRSDAKRGDLMPSSRKGKLDAKLLAKHGVTKERLEDNDALLFFQLLAPVCDPKKSGIEGDGRFPFFTAMRSHSNTYATGEKNWGGGYGHEYKLTSEAELVHWIGVPIRHGARGGSPGALYHRWQSTDPDHDSLIAQSISYSRWIQIKAIIKLNNNMTTPKKWQPGYDPASKYDLIYKCMVHNMNHFTERADMDATLDETTWGFSGYCGDSGGRLINKPGKDKGGQTTMIFDISNRYPRAYHHRHKLQPRPDGFGQQGPAEVHDLLNQIDAHIAGRSEDQASYRVDDPMLGSTTYHNKIIYATQPHITADNHFSGCNVLEHAGRKGYGLTVTTRRDRFPDGLKKYFHHAKELATKLTTKVMRYENPIVAVKEVEATETTHAYTKTHVSFQSTGATNISGVNNLPSCSLYVTPKSRGRGEEKRVWGIENCEPRELYLSTYYGVDSVDHMIVLAMIRYITWKYWHSPFLHGLSMIVIAVYDMYRECCEGELRADWFVPVKKRMSFRQFRLRLSEQMLEYSPANNLYPGDSSFRKWTKKTKQQKRKADPDEKMEGLTVDGFKKAKSSTGRCVPRLCGDLDLFDQHVNSMVKRENKTACEVCGRATAFMCTICDKRLCLFRDKAWSGRCVSAYHNDSFFGLAKGDAVMHGKKKGDWVAPKAATIKLNRRRIGEIKEEIKKDGERTAGGEC